MHELAREARGYFEKRQRDNGEGFWSFNSETTPEWVWDLARDAHGDMLPDDWRYAYIVESLDEIAETDAEEVGDMDPCEPDIYNSDRLTWLASNLERPGYCDQAMQDFGVHPTDTLEIIGIGQAYERDEVRALVWAFLERRAEDMEEAT